MAASGQVQGRLSVAGSWVRGPAEPPGVGPSLPPCTCTGRGMARDPRLGERDRGPRVGGPAGLRIRAQGCKPHRRALRPPPTPGPCAQPPRWPGRVILQPPLGLRLCAVGTWTRSQERPWHRCLWTNCGEHCDPRWAQGQWGGHRAPKALPGPALLCTSAHTDLLADPSRCPAGSQPLSQCRSRLWAAVTPPLPGRPPEVTLRKTPYLVTAAPASDPCPLVPTRRLEAVVSVGRVHTGLRGRPADADTHLPTCRRRRGRRLRGGPGGRPPVQPQSLRP